MATVLVVDPSPSVRETLRIVLASEHEVVACASLDEVPADLAPDLIALGLPVGPRDERVIGRTLARVAPAAPVLLLHAPADVAVHELAAPHRRVDFLGKPFDAYTVRAAVAALVRGSVVSPPAADVVDAHRPYLEFPYLSQSAAAIAREVVGRDVPVMLWGEPGTGAPAVARALHALGPVSGPFVVLDAARLVEGELGRRVRDLEARDGGAIFVAGIEAMPRPMQYEMVDVLRRLGAPAGAPVLVLTSAARDVGALASSGAFLHDLAYRVTTVAIPLVPLRERLEDLPQLAETLSRSWARRLGIGDVTYTPAALERLASYLWFGNVAELEAVLARTLTLRRSAVVDAADLVFLADDAGRAVRDRTAGRPRPGTTSTTRSADAGPNLEIVLGELAHELRNPMVTIKTFTQHLDSVLADAETRARFAALMSEAVDRMDGMLEVLLDFARFRAPVPQPVDVRSVLDRVLGEQAEDLARRHVVVERNGAAAGTVTVDEAQIVFAMRSLMRGLVDTLTPHSPLKIRGVQPGVIELELHAEPSTAARLRAYVEPTTGDGGETPPLAWVLAASLVQRNGGRMRVRHDDAATTIRLEWASASS